MSKEIKQFSAPTHEEISAYAYQLWETEGRPHGRDREHWMQAQAHLMADRQFEAGLLAQQPAQATAASQEVKSQDQGFASKPERRRKPEGRAKPIIRKQAAYAS